MNLLEAKRELIEHGYEIRQMNECYSNDNEVHRIMSSCGYSTRSYRRAPHAKYKSDSELSSEELQKRQDLRALKQDNANKRAALKKKITSFLTSFQGVDESQVYVNVSGSKDNIKGEGEINLLKGTKKYDPYSHENIITVHFNSIGQVNGVEFDDASTSTLRKLFNNEKAFNIIKSIVTHDLTRE